MPIVMPLGASFDARHQLPCVRDTRRHRSDYQRGSPGPTDARLIASKADRETDRLSDDRPFNRCFNAS
jgi:hypothetical protein